MDGLVAPKPSSQIADMETWISGSGGVSLSGRNSISGITLIPRPFRARDLVPIAEVGSARLTLLERVTTGVGSVSGALGRNLTRSADHCDFPYLMERFPISMTFCPNPLLTDNRKMPDNFFRYSFQLDSFHSILNIRVIISNMHNVTFVYVKSIFHSFDHDTRLLNQPLICQYLHLNWQYCRSWCRQQILIYYKREIHRCRLCV